MKTLDSWRVRRKVIFTSLSLCFIILLYLLFFGEDTRLNETLANGAFLLSGSVIGAYVFGAVWDDKK
jgi:hypothetical protein